MSGVNRDNALSLAKAIAAGELRAVDLVEACLDRVAAREDAVGAWIEIDPKRALAEASARDAEPAKSPLHGIPVGVKDIIDTADMPTCYGSAIYAEHRPAADAACVSLLRRAGMVVLGKTVTTEFAFRHPGKTRNPHNPAHTPGGSSSGSAAAVADVMVPLALGTQTAGSVIRPASFCGVVGYKPTFGTINRTGVRPFADFLDTVGLFARTVPDAAAFVRILGGWLPGDVLLQPVSAPRIGLCRTPMWERAEPASRAALDEAAARASAGGARVRELVLPRVFSEAARAHGVVMAYEGWRALSHERAHHADRLSEELKSSLAVGGTYGFADYRAAVETAVACRATLKEVFADCDVVLAPSAPGEAPHGLSSTGDPVFNALWTLLGTPCVTLPGLVGPQGLPVGVQVVGLPGSDLRTLASADWLHHRLG